MCVIFFPSPTFLATDNVVNAGLVVESVVLRTTVLVAEKAVMALGVADTVMLGKGSVADVTVEGADDPLCDCEKRKEK